MKKRVIISIYAVKRHPSIKVQRARCHVTVICGLKQPQSPKRLAGFPNLHIRFLPDTP